MARMTLQTVADKVGVSRMTVSNAFSRPDQLSAELRDRILAAADELGYVGPDPAARALARGTTGAVGIVLTSVIGTAFGDEVATQFLGAIVEGLAPSGLSLTLLSTEETGGRMPARDVPMDGTLVYHCDPRSPALDWLQRRKLPHRLRRPGADPTTCRASTSTIAAAPARPPSISIALGHRRIGIVNAGVVGPHGLRPPRPARPAVVGDHSADVRLAGRAGCGRASTPVVNNQPHSTEEEGYAALPLLLDADPEHHRRAVLLRHAGARRHAGRPGPRPRTAAATCRWSASTTTRWRHGSGPR